MMWASTPLTSPRVNFSGIVNRMHTTSACSPPRSETRRDWTAAVGIAVLRVDLRILHPRRFPAADSKPGNESIHDPFFIPVHDAIGCASNSHGDFCARSSSSMTVQTKFSAFDG
jgi:hypothetical protein